MTATRVSAARAVPSALPAFAICAATAVTGCVLSLTVALPAAHADPLGDLRGRVNGARGTSTCPALNYSVALEGEAQHLIGNNLPGVPPAGQYQGTFVPFVASANQAEDADIHVEVQADSAIHDCSYKDFGVGFFRTHMQSGDGDLTAIVLGKPAAPAAPPAPAPDQKPVGCAGYQLPPGSDCSKTPNPNPPPPPAQPVVNAITASFGKPGLTSIQLRVTNSSALTAACHYDAEAQSLNPFVPSKTVRDFQVAPHTTPSNPHVETFNGAPTLTNYQVTITCTDASGKQQDPIGTVQLSELW